MSRDIHAQRVLILDFGSQYTQLIVRKVRELGYFAHLYAPEDLDERHGLRQAVAALVQDIVDFQLTLQP